MTQMKPPPENPGRFTILVDYERVSIMGVIVASWRDRKVNAS
jgi:SOS-response transcriptional repressor LexA